MSVTIKGDKALKRKLRALPIKVRGKALLDAANAGGKIYRDAARDNAPRGKTGKLKRDINHQVTARTADNITVGVSWRVGRASRTPAFYGLFVHQGTKQRVRKSGGVTGAVTRRNPFLTKAFDEKTSEANRAVADVLRRSVEEVARG